MSLGSPIKEKERELNYLDKELNMKQNLVGNGFQSIPREKSGEHLCRVNVMGEITSADNFEAEDIYIIYELNKPSWWNFEFDEFTSRIGDEYDPEMNREKSITQTASQVKRENGVLTANFAFPLDWEFSTEEDQMINRWPIICFQVNGVDYWDRSTIEGYGFVEIPRAPGFHQLQVRTWKPEESFSMKINKFYLGGSTKLKDLHSISETYTRDEQDRLALLNKMNMATESSGTINLTLNVIIQSTDFKRTQKTEAQDLNLRARLGEKMRQQQEFVPPALMRTNVGYLNRFPQI